MHKVWFFVAASAACLAGCKSGINVPLSYSTATAATQSVIAELYLEVGACRDADTGLDSTQLLNAKQKVAYVVPGARFSGCAQQGLSEFAYFDVPVQVGAQAVNESKGFAASILNGSAAYFAASEELKQRFAQVSQDVYGFSLGDFSVTLRFENDSGKDWEVYVPSAIVKQSGFSDTPFHADSFILKKDEAVAFEISNVATLKILDGSGYALAFSLTQDRP